MHIDLATTTTSLTTIASTKRTYSVLGGDGTTKVTFFVADASAASSGVPLIDGRNLRGNALVLRSSQQATFDDASTFVGYALTGTAPTAVFVDGEPAATQGAAGPNWISANAWALVTGTAYVAAPGEFVKVNTAAATTVTLPTAVGIAGQRIRVQDATGGAATHNITIATTSNQTIQGTTPVAISANNGGQTYVSDGANWVYGT